MEHHPDVSTDGNSVLPESQEDPNERWSEGWTQEELLIEGETMVGEGAVKDQTILAVVFSGLTGLPDCVLTMAVA